MKQQEQKQKTRPGGIFIGTVVLLVLLSGSMAWAEKNSGKVELKKNDDAAQTQTQSLPAPIDPFRDMLRLQQEMDHLFDRTLNPYVGFPDFDAAWNQQLQQPAMDLTEKPEAYTVQMELPGLDKSDINIEVKDRVLTVSGEHKVATKTEDENEKVLVQERSVSSFSREVVLPKSVAADQVSAEYKNGILTIALPKTEKDPATHQIEIK